jgi:hypothetical protein
LLSGPEKSSAGRQGALVFHPAGAPAALSLIYLNFGLVFHFCPFTLRLVLNETRRFWTGKSTH